MLWTRLIVAMLAPATNQPEPDGMAWNRKDVPPALMVVAPADQWWAGSGGPPDVRGVTAPVEETNHTKAGASSTSWSRWTT